MMVVGKVNDQKVKNLAHVVRLLRDAKGDRVTFEFVDTKSGLIVFDRKRLIEAIPDIQADNGILRHGSPKMLEIWNGEQTAGQ